MKSRRHVLSARAYKEISLISTEIRDDLREKIRYYKSGKSQLASSFKNGLHQIMESVSAEKGRSNIHQENDLLFKRKANKSNTLFEKFKKSKDLEDNGFSKSGGNYSPVSQEKAKFKESNFKKPNKSNENDDNEASDTASPKFSRKNKKLMTALPTSVQPSKSIFNIRRETKKSVDLYNIYKKVKSRKIYVLSPRSEKALNVMCDSVTFEKNEKSKIGESKIKLFLRQLAIYRSKILRGFEKNKPNKVIKNFMTILMISMELNDVHVFTQIVIILGHILRDMGDYDKSIYFYNQARICCDLTKNFDYKLEILMDMASLARKVKSYEYSIRLLKRALQYCWLLKKNEAEMKVYELMGQCYCYAGDMERAKYYHDRGLGGQTEDLHPDSIILRMSRDNMNNYMKTLVYKFEQFNELFISHLSLPLDHMRNIGKKLITRVFPFRYNFNEIENKFNYNYSTCDEVLAKIMIDKEFTIDIPTPRIGKRIKIGKDTLSAEAKTSILRLRKNRPKKDSEFEGFYYSDNFKVLEKIERGHDFDKYKYDLETHINLRLSENGSKERNLSSLIQSINERLKYHGERVKTTTGVKSRIFVNELRVQSQEKIKADYLKKIIVYFDVLLLKLVSKYIKTPTRHK